MRKMTGLLVAITILAAGAVQEAFARPMGGGMMGGGHCWNCEMYGPGGLDEASMQKYEQFLKETVELRKQLAIKQGEANALLNRENPDEKKVGKAAGEIFELRNKLREKAVSLGLKPGMGCGMGMGMGMGMGRGMGHGPGMMHGQMPGGPGQPAP